MSGIVACWVTATSTLVFNSQDSAVRLAVPEVYRVCGATPKGANSQIQPDGITGQMEKRIKSPSNRRGSQGNHFGRLTAEPMPCGRSPQHAKPKGRIRCPKVQFAEQIAL